MTDLYARSFLSWKQAQILIGALFEIGKIVALIASIGSVILLFYGIDITTVLIGFALFFILGSICGLLFLLIVYHSNKWVTRAGIFTIGLGIYIAVYINM